MSEAAIRDSFETLQLTRNRTEWKKASNGADILSDVYNANPTAMRLIFRNLFRPFLPIQMAGSWRFLRI